MTDRSIDPPPLWDRDEDYTDCVCLLLRKGKATLIDVEKFDRYSRIKWCVMGTSIFYQEAYKPGKRPKRYRMVQMSRDVMYTGYDSMRKLWKHDVDHINRNRWDNRRSNLRFATESQNGQNRPGLPNSSSKYKGVSQVKGKNKWVVAATLKGKTYRLGTFDSEDMAARAYNKFISERCPEFGYINPITIKGNDS